MAEKWYKTKYTNFCRECDACTDVLTDYTNGDYLFLCNEANEIGTYDLEMGTNTICPRGKWESEDNNGYWVNRC